MSACVIVGVVPGQPDTVVQQAAMFAARFNAELVCASVDAGQYQVYDLGYGTMTSLPLTADSPERAEERFDPDLAARLAALLDGRGFTWSTRALVGDPAQALGDLADTLNAAMIVVGTREATLRASLQEFINGSVAVQLAHRQHRPVVVIPLAPVPSDQALPWDPA
ncbi:universal stress protein [Cryobacterium gelidum]|uniref:Universal stress protein n=1 Tax=Cryobacterium gelidum TaxID=1259164 RepID=A0A4R9AYN2_9MICO|nr:universal stress protein [Cryobacterium gelidum]TFD71453.1 universal stress protein [Cryobacterium gelidum]